MPDAPERYLAEDEYDLDQTLLAVQARRRGDPPPKFESPSYRRHRVEVLRVAGLDAEADEIEAEDEVVGLEDQTPHEHLQRIQRGRR